MTSSLFLEAGFSNNTEYYTNSYEEGVGQDRGTAEWYAGAARNELDLGGYKTAAPLPLTESPKANYWSAAATYVTGAHTIKFGANMRWGTYTHTRDANADLTQQYPQQPHRCALVGARQRVDPQHTAVARREAQRRPWHLPPGFVAPQSPHHQFRHPVGSAQVVRDGGRVAGGPLRRRAHLPRNFRCAELEGLGAATGARV